MMTTLQIVLAIVGVSLIAIIVIYNILQERKFRKEADRMFSHKREDIMLGESVLHRDQPRRGESRIQLTDDADNRPRGAACRGRGGSAAAAVAATPARSPLLPGS
jgi:hypothetical protein